MKTSVRTKLLLVLAALVGFGVFLVNESNDRAADAVSWSRPGHFEVRAVGTLNKTLLLSPANDAPNICPLLVPSIITDPKMMAQIHLSGFTEIQCGDSKTELQ
jgi:hypothetical protein